MKGNMVSYVDFFTEVEKLAFLRIKTDVPFSAKFFTDAEQGSKAFDRWR